MLYDAEQATPTCAVSCSTELKTRTALTSGAAPHCTNAFWLAVFPKQQQVVVKTL